ncbi:MAG: hypothetical protein NVSMB22_07220 [Chloroflexota bacterium]
MMRIIPTRVHGVLDYVGAITLLTLPRILGWDTRVTKLLTGAAGAGVIASLCTRYELGVAGVLTMKSHLALDAINGGALCAAALVWRDQEEAGVVGALYGLGVFEIAAALLTETEPSAISIRQSIGQ